MQIKDQGVNKELPFLTNKQGLSDKMPSRILPRFFKLIQLICCLLFIVDPCKDLADYAFCQSKSICAMNKMIPLIYRDVKRMKVA